MRAMSGAVRRLALTACLITLVSGSVPAEDRPLRLLGVIYLGDVPTLVAKQKDLFRQQGLEVDVELGHSGRENLARLLAGEAEFALMAPTPFVIHRLQVVTEGQEHRAVILASLVHGTRLEALLVRADSDIRKPSDLLDRRVAMMPGTNTEYLWWLYSQFHQLDRNRITIVEASTESAGRLLTSGEVDAAVVWEPWSQLAAEAASVPLRILSVGEGYTAKWLLVARQDVVREQPAAAVRLLRGYAAALDLIEEQPEDAMRRYTERAGLPASVGEPVRLPAFGLSLDWSLLADLQQQLEWARERDPTMAERETDLLSWIKPQPLITVNPAAVSLPGTRDRRLEQ